MGGEKEAVPLADDFGSKFDRSPASADEQIKSEHRAPTDALQRTACMLPSQMGGTSGSGSGGTSSGNDVPGADSAKPCLSGFTAREPVRMSSSHLRVSTGL